MWLGQRIVPRALVQGFRGGVSADVLDRVLGARISAAEQPPIRARALRAMEPILDEAFPPELLAGIAAQFLARNYTADELVALRAREESAIGRKLREFDRSAAAGPARSGAASDEAREALALRMFTDAERREIEAFAATPLGHKGLALAPDLVGFFVGELERRYASVRAHIEPRLADVVEAALATLTPPAP